MNIDALTRDGDRLTRRLTAMLGGDVDAAQDVRQEALVRAWRSLPGELEPEAQRAWLGRTARNLAIDELRRRARRQTVALDVAGELPAPQTDDDGAAREALLRLSAHERFILLLRFQGALAYTEIASLLGISEEAARKRTSRAREAFIGAYRAIRVGQRPVIALVIRDEPQEPYVEWLQRAGADVRRLRTPTEHDLVLADGLVFTGATVDLHPALYGERRRRGFQGDPDLGVDRADLAIVQRALSLDLPIVGVCRGHQLLNIATGGTLYQDVRLDGATRRPHDAGLHEVQTTSDSAARRLLGRRSNVESEHHQAVRRLGRKLRVTATSPDALVESIERVDRRFVVGLQWHPERRNDVAANNIAEALLHASTPRAA